MTPNIETQLAVVVEKVTNIEKKIMKMESRLEEEFVTRGELNAQIGLIDANNQALGETVNLLKRIVYGIIGIIITTVVGVALNTIIK